MKNNSFTSLFRGDFVTGLAIVLPGVISIGIVYWSFGTIANFTDRLLFFLPQEWTHSNEGAGPVHWYWSIAALILTVIIIGLIGRFTRYYLGREVVKWADHAIMQVPLLRNIYGTVKQVNEAFSSNKSSFKQVAMVPFPHAGARSMGFVTGEPKGLSPSGEKLIGVFIPTTPNPTSGFLMMYPESDVTKLDMSVPEGIKFIISLGAIPPVFRNQELEAGDAESTGAPKSKHGL